MIKDLVHTRIVSTVLIVACIVVSAGMAGFFLDLFDTAEGANNLPPTAIAGGEDLSGFTVVALEFNGSASFDNDGEIVSYEWDFGDGFSGIGVRPSHTYYDPGEYVATLTVTDNDGARDTDTVGVSISDDPEGMYQLVTVKELLTNGTEYYGTLVRLENAIVYDAGSYDNGYGSDPAGWVKFDVTDSTTTQSIECYVEGGAERPLELYRGNLLRIYSLMDKYNGQWELNVRADTPDRVEVMPAVYNNYTLAELLGDKTAHLNELVRITELEVVSVEPYGWIVTDNTTTMSAYVYAQPGASAPTYVNVSDYIWLQGIFTFYDINQNEVPDDDEWEIKVRGAADDIIVRTYEFDYPPIISAVSHSPDVPSPYSPAVVTATVSDNTGLASVVLNYNYNNTPQPSVTMTGTGTSWTASIPAADAGVEVTYNIEAMDVKGQVVTSDDFSYVIVDAPPSIDDIFREPDWIRPTDNVTITVFAHDDSGSLSVTLTYTNDSWATWFNLTLADNGTAPDITAADGNFTGQIGPFPEGTTVKYYVTAEDGTGQTDVSAEAEFISSFDQPPQFDGLYRSVEMPASTDDVTVIANVTDDLKMDNVTLYYSVDVGAG